MEFHHEMLQTCSGVQLRFSRRTPDRGPGRGIRAPVGGARGVRFSGRKAPPRNRAPKPISRVVKKKIASIFHFVLDMSLTSGGLWYVVVPREADSGAASSGVARPSGAISENPRFSRRERCARRLVRAIRRANRAGAKRAPAGAGASAQDTRGKGTAAPGRTKERR